MRGRRTVRSVPGGRRNVYRSQIVQIRKSDWPRPARDRNVFGCPMNKPITPAESETVHRIVADLEGRPGPLLEVRHAIQAALGYVPAGAVPLVAEGLNLSRAEVHGVVTFYHYFRHTAPGKHTVSLCRAEACQSGRRPARGLHPGGALRHRRRLRSADRFNAGRGGHRSDPGWSG